MNIDDTNAAQNRFFKLCANGAQPRTFAPLLLNWHAITESFCLGSLQYTGLLAAKRLECTSHQEVEALERALAVAVDIAAGEFGFGQQGSRGFHYNMFARLGQLPMGSLDTARTIDQMKVVETVDLVAWFARAFSDALMGAGVFRVVERTAFNIVEAMDRLFPAGSSDAGGWSEWQREYITLHLELEPIHADEVEILVEALAWSQDACHTIDIATEKTCELFGHFWERMALDVFGPEAGKPKEED